MKAVIIVNGKPRAGKDSTVEAMTFILQHEGVAVRAFSSIDPVRNMLTKAGIDVSRKTPKDRALLAEVGDALQRHDKWRTKFCITETYNFFRKIGQSDGVIFLHVREAAIINDLRNYRFHLWPSSEFLVINVRSNRAENVTSNAADMGTEDIEYDAVIENNGTIVDLDDACRRLLTQRRIILPPRLLL